MKGSEHMPAKENKKQYDMQYAKDKLKRIPLNVQKEKYEEIKAAADAAGEPINGYIKIPDTQKPDPAATMDRQSIPTNGPSVKDLNPDPATDPSGSSPHHYETLEEKLERMRKAHVSQEE